MPAGSRWSTPTLSGAIPRLFADRTAARHPACSTAPPLTGGLRRRSCSCRAGCTIAVPSAFRQLVVRPLIANTVHYSLLRRSGRASATIFGGSRRS
ncbi:hypothetical protein FRACA_1700018 [Frankia canadensis]|uniref:Uncharacterized protein n=1 Tax=Frankia canadensis TaxID=1836972 RepID=A0A2I2KN95_9ACTN|nr:hypothetical protein FRACA_1700018 [Frankia canadensis]SOU54416.1 hypothetical protein FRACA_1700018 [Frankia canadensis]